VLVTGGTMMIRSLVKQQTMDPGFDRRNLTAGYILLPAAKYKENSQTIDFYKRSLGNLRRDPNVESAALVQTLPLGGDNSYLSVRLDGEKDPQDKMAGNMVVSPGYFSTMRIPLVSGRDFTENDHADAEKVVIVNQTFVKRYWPGESNVIGRRVRVANDQAPWLTVVGIVGDVLHVSPSDPPRPEIYRPHEQMPERIMMLLAKSRVAGQSNAGAMRSAVWQVDRDQPVFRLQTVDELYRSMNSGERATTKVLGGLAVIALILAAVGTYGVMAYTAAQRLREIGIRMALGASNELVFRMVLRGGVVLSGIGLLIGLPAAYGVTPLLRLASNALEPQDVRVYLGVGALLFAVALAASAAPAWRATRVDPAQVLRSE
jgi:predicted permease